MYNKTFNLLATAGVERYIKLWSQFPQEIFRGSDMQTTESSTEIVHEDDTVIRKRDIYIRREVSEIIWYQRLHAFLVCSCRTNPCSDGSRF